MKSSELMVGDYVTIAPSGMLIKVAATHKRKVAYHACTSKLSWVREGLLRPITLTSEILEKNGFKYGDGYGYSFVNRKELSGDGFEEEKVYINTALNTLIIYTAASSIHLPVKYIHELQHALRICGIEKEIIL